MNRKRKAKVMYFAVIVAFVAVWLWAVLTMHAPWRFAVQVPAYIALAIAIAWIRGWRDDNGGKNGSTGSNAS